MMLPDIADIYQSHIDVLYEQERRDEIAQEFEATLNGRWVHPEEYEALFEDEDDDDIPF